MSLYLEDARQTFGEIRSVRAAEAGVLPEAKVTMPEPVA